jgi:2-polyprenyl-3-methyl-5-hydroxy-6-metoxy-1,4-benzoquinol methylase
MGGCCVPRGYDKLFGERTAKRDLRRYRRRGLDGTAEALVDFLRGRGVGGLRILEIGGGVGALEAELLQMGAAHAVNVEMSPAYEPYARELWRESGVEERAEYRVGDVTKNGVASADAVVMHKVVCCYPDADALVGAAAVRTGRYLVLSFPRERRLTRIGFGGLNLLARILRWEYRSFIHPVSTISRAAERHELRLVHSDRSLVWQIAAFERSVR